MNKKYIYIAGLGIVLLGAAGFATQYFGIVSLPGFGNKTAIATETTVSAPAKKEKAASPITSPATTAADTPSEAETIELDPKYSLTLTNHAKKLIISHKLEDAIPILERAVALDPENAGAVEILRVLKAGEVPVISPEPEATESAKKGITPELTGKGAGDSKGDDQKVTIKLNTHTTPPKETEEKLPEIVVAIATPTAKPSANSPPKKIVPPSPGESKKVVEDEQIHNPSAQDKLYAEVLTKRAAELAQAGDVEEAQKFLKKARALDPESSISGHAAGTEESAEGALSQLMPAFDLPKNAQPTPIPAPSEEIESSSDCMIPIVEDEIDKFFYDNIELFKPLPKQFRVGETYMVSGGVKQNFPATKALAYFGPKDDPDGQVTFVADVKDSIFHIPVYFSKQGEYLFSVLPGEKGLAKAAKIEVIDPPCEPAITSKSKAPDSLQDTVKNGNPVLTWNGTRGSLYRIDFRQGELAKSLYVNDATEMTLPLAEFKDFTEGNIRILLWGALAGENSLDRQSDWAFGGEKTYKAVRHVSRLDNILTDVTMTEKFEPKGVISIYGTATQPLSNKLVIIPPDEKIFEVDFEIKNKDFSGHFTADQDGPYLVEINQNDALSLFTGGSVPNGSLAILPDYFDLSPARDKTLELDAAEASTEMLRYLNRERTTRKLGLLKLDSSLSNLAKYRADDMCKRNYFGHVDPDGKNAGDYLDTYNVKVDIGENIVSSSDMRSSHEVLMRSPAHRELIIDPKFVSVGFGFCLETEQEGNIITVQIFGEK